MHRGSATSPRRFRTCVPCSAPLSPRPPALFPRSPTRRRPLRRRPPSPRRRPREAGRRRRPPEGGAPEGATDEPDAAETSRAEKAPPRRRGRRRRARRRPGRPRPKKAGCSRRPRRPPDAAKTEAPAAKYIRDGDRVRRLTSLEHERQRHLTRARCAPNRQAAIARGSGGSTRGASRSSLRGTRVVSDSTRTSRTRAARDRP